MAKLAGVPTPVLKRAEEIVTELSDNDISKKAGNIDVSDSMTNDTAETMDGIGRQFSLFDYQINDDSPEILLELKEIDLNDTTPMAALGILADVQKRLQKNAG